MQHERKESSPELFSSLKPTAQEKGSASTKQSRNDLPSELEELGPSKQMKEVADIEAELQDHYIGTLSLSLSLSLSLKVHCHGPIVFVNLWPTAA